MAELDIKKSGQQQSSSVQRRTGRSYDPFAFSLLPSEMFGMNPFSLMRRMSDEMERAVRGQGSAAGGGSWTPAIEIFERDGRYVVHADLPGLKQENVKVEVNNNVLTLRGERRSQHEENEGGVHRSERHYGHFFRSIPLPDGADVEHARAQFQDGVLEVSIPVPEEQTSRRQIPIEAGEVKPQDNTPSGSKSGGRK